MDGKGGTVVVACCGDEVLGTDTEDEESFFEADDAGNQLPHPTGPVFSLTPGVAVQRQ